jgi:hypothetical protein
MVSPEAEQVQATIIDRRMRGAWEKRGSKSGRTVKNPQTEALAARSHQEA